MDSYIIQTSELQLTQMEFLIRLLVTTGIGLLLGLEREHSALVKQEGVFAGIRTFVLLTILGFVGAAMHFLLSPMVFVAILAGVILLTGISYWITALKGDIGGTSELASVAAVLLGAMTFLGFIEISLMLTVIILVMLSSKVRLQAVIGQITQEEMYALVRFVVVALLIFPFLPDENYGPFNAINPREVGWVVILTSGLGFLGYVLMRVFGANKGILFTGILGGLVSSTMVTWIFAKKSRENTKLNAVYTSGILAASTIMVLRVLLWVYLFNRSLLAGMAVPLGMVFLAAAVTTFYFFLKGKKEESIKTTLPVGKPLELTTALLFGLLYVGIVLVINYANEYFGQEGIFITSGIAGLSDVDAITISISKMSLQSISILTAMNAVLIATVANTIMKFSIALWFGSRELKKYILIGYGLIFLAAVVGFVVMNA